MSTKNDRPPDRNAEAVFIQKQLEQAHEYIARLEARLREELWDSYLGNAYTVNERAKRIDAEMAKLKEGSES